MKRIAYILGLVILCAASGDDDHANETGHDDHGHDDHADETGHDDHADETGHDDHGHAHGSGAFEWAGTFDVTAHNIVTWSAQADATGAYADPGMKILVVRGNAANTLEGNAPGLSESVETLGGEGFAESNEPCTNLPNGAVIPISTGDPPACYTIQFDVSLHTSVFRIDTTLGSPDGIRTETITKVNGIAIFAQHFPTEFERDAHYLKGVDGTDIEPLHEHPEPTPPSTPGKRWGAAIGASFLVMACTLIGVFFIAPVFVKLREEHENMVNTLASAFAAGALVAAAFFLMLYEATHLIEIKPGVRTEAEAAAWWGSAVLLGLVTPFILDTIVAIIQGEKVTNHAAVKPSQPEKTGVEDAEKAVADPDATEVNPNRERVLVGVLIGDFLHNLVDGFFIGAAFTNCSTSMGWTISAATIYHELAQEISDYLVLTNPKMGGLNKWLALGFNFLSGTSVLMGTCIVMSSEPSNFDTGILLAYGAGVYVQIACTECMPRVHEFANTIMLRATSFLLFCIGAIAIGLVLLDHEHCVAEAGGGHAHGAH